jgi:hypothetical protein
MGSYHRRYAWAARILHLDMNTVAVTLGTMVLLISVAIYG